MGCHYKHVRAAELKLWHQRATIGGLVSLVRVIWILMRTFFFFFKWSSIGWSGFCSLVYLPPLLLPIKGLSAQPWFISWIKQGSIILLTDGIKINSCELWGTLDVYVLTHTHTRTRTHVPILCLCTVVQRSYWAVMALTAVHVLTVL